ncbi:MAG: substrate-binding domain-containing protein [Treponema sp.]|jgi:simple sugar transport system substrate-binding protein/ribose transport system substrate-binding protein|nr:substrate-binding domain-containing protein [Treponema sp.]
MKKKLFVISAALLFLAMPLAVVMAAGAKDSGEVVVAGVVFQEDQFMKLLTLGYQDAAKAAGVRVLLGNTGNDQAKEAELINTYVAQKVSGLVIAPLNPATSIPVLEKASSSIKVATTNTNLTNAPFIVGGYTSDNVNLGATSGEAAGKFIREKLGGKAKIAILQFKSQLPEQSADRVNGFIDAVKKLNPDVEIVADQDAWLQDRAVQVAGDILTAHNDVNIIYGANDGGTIGSVMAVKNAGLAGKCFVFGIDTGDQQLAMLRDSDNILQAVTGQDPYQMGYNAMQVLIDAVQGKDFSATRGKTIIVPGLLVSRSDPAGIDAFEKNLKEKINR